MKRWIVGSLLLFTAGGLPAQSGLDLDVRITPRAGLMTPADWFYVEYAHFGLDPVEWTEAAILRSYALGLAVEVEVPGSGLWIRGEVLRTVDAVTSMVHAVLWESNGFDPPRVERIPYRVGTAVTMGTLELAFPTRFTVGPVQPYVVAGVGGKRYSFETEPFDSLGTNVVLPQNGVTAMATVGAGVTLRVLGLNLDLQVKDAMGQYWESLQHDVLFLAGATWTLR